MGRLKHLEHVSGKISSRDAHYVSKNGVIFTEYSTEGSEIFEAMIRWACGYYEKENNIRRNLVGKFVIV